MYFRHSIASLLVLAFGAVIVLLGTAVTLSVSRLSHFNDAVTVVTGRQLEKLETVNAWIYQLEETARHTRNMLILDDKEKIQEEIESTREAIAKRKQYMEALQQRVDSEEERRSLQTVIDTRSAYMPLEEEYLQQVTAGQMPLAKKTLLERTRPAQLEYLAQLRKLVDFQKNTITRQVAALSISYKRSRTLIILISTLAVAMACLLTAGIVRAIQKPLARAVAHFGAIRRGDFTGVIQVNSRNEIGQMLAALKITQQSLHAAAVKAADHESQIAAIGRAQVVVEFDLDGRVRTANEHFLRIMGYSLEDIQGQHHSLFVDPAEKSSPSYQAFWEQLGRGQHETGTYKRIARDGREVWLHASYSPILDPTGKPYKVVKYASDVTEQIKMRDALDCAVRETQAAVQEAISGILTARIETGGKTGQIEALATSVNALIENMMSVVAAIKQSATQVRNGAEEISTGNANLSQRTEEQASSLEETASTMEEMTSTVRATAESATQASKLALAAREQADKGSSIVTAAVASMDRISDAGRQIADIIGVIDDIAFQTNLLALNAAVEAARAGEQGRGFAVVASEVRNLAGRSATAAKEIKMLIKETVGKVEEGGKLVNQSGQALEDIGVAVKRVTDVMEEIAQASQSQASGIEQVNRSIMQMDASTQQNAALVEEATAASASILSQATSLSELVARYQVNTEETPATPPARLALIR